MEFVHEQKLLFKKKKTDSPTAKQQQETDNLKTKVNNLFQENSDKEANTKMLSKLKLKKIIKVEDDDLFSSEIVSSPVVGSNKK